MLDIAPKICEAFAKMGFLRAEVMADFGSSCRLRVGAVDVEVAVGSHAITVSTCKDGVADQVDIEKHSTSAEVAHAVLLVIEKSQKRPSKDEKPQTVKVDARDIKPYFYSLWCSIEDGAPFPNPIVGMQWSEDGEHLWLMLESHNFYRCKPDEVLDLVAEEPESEYIRAKYSNWKLPPKPEAKP